MFSRNNELSACGNSLKKTFLNKGDLHFSTGIYYSLISRKQTITTSNVITVLKAPVMDISFIFSTGKHAKFSSENATPIIEI